MIIFEFIYVNTNRDYPSCQNRSFHWISINISQFVSQTNHHLVEKFQSLTRLIPAFIFLEKTEDYFILQFTTETYIDDNNY